MGTAHSIRIGTNNKYDLVDVLEMDPMRRRMLVASISVESEDIEARRKNKASIGGRR